MSTPPTNDALREEEELVRAKPPFLRRVRIRNYKSIAFCDVTLEPLTILVGKNGSGKSNFLDALGFLRDLLDQGLHQAYKKHGGQQIPTRHGKSRDVSFAIEVEFGFSDSNWVARYSLSIRFLDAHPAEIVEEHLEIMNPASNEVVGFFRDNRHVQILNKNIDPPPVAILDVLPSDAILRSFPSVIARQFLLELTSIGVYNFVPQRIRELQQINFGWPLDHDGSNLASVLKETTSVDSWFAQRIQQFLSAVVREIQRIWVVTYGEYVTVQFEVDSEDPDKPFVFDASSMSEGTLRVLAALVAVYQNIPPDGSPSLVAIEEPETALHPAAMRALVGAFDEAILRTQILLTTHSPELLDTEKIEAENIRVVEMRNGSTWITKIDEVSESLLQDGLTTLSKLESERQFQLDQDDLDRQIDLAREERSVP